MTAEQVLANWPTVVDTRYGEWLYLRSTMLEGLAAYGDEQKAKDYREGVEAMRDAATERLSALDENAWAEVMECVAVGLLKGAPK